MLTINGNYESAIRKLYKLAAKGPDASSEAHRLAARLLAIAEGEERAGRLTTAELDSLTVSLAIL